MIQGNVRTSMYLKLIGNIYSGLLVAKAFSFEIVLFNKPHLIFFLSFKYALRKHVLGDEFILNEN